MFVLPLSLEKGPSVWSKHTMFAKICAHCTLRSTGFVGFSSPQLNNNNYSCTHYNSPAATRKLFDRLPDGRLRIDGKSNGQTRKKSLSAATTVFRKSNIGPTRLPRSRPCWRFYHGRVVSRAFLWTTPTGGAPYGTSKPKSRATWR